MPVNVWKTSGVRGPHPLSFAPADRNKMRPPVQPAQTTSSFHLQLLAALHNAHPWVPLLPHIPRGHHLTRSLWEDWGNCAARPQQSSSSTLPKLLLLWFTSQENQQKCHSPPRIFGFATFTSLQELHKQATDQEGSWGCNPYFCPSVPSSSKVCMAYQGKNSGGHGQLQILHEGWVQTHGAERTKDSLLPCVRSMCRMNRSSKKNTFFLHPQASENTLQPVPAPRQGDATRPDRYHLQQLLM